MAWFWEILRSFYTPGIMRGFKTSSRLAEARRRYLSHTPTLPIDEDKHSTWMCWADSGLAAAQEVEGR